MEKIKLMNLNMQRSTQNDQMGVSMKLKHVQEKLADCRSMMDDALSEVEAKFPKSIFDNIESVHDTFVAEMYSAEDETQTQFERPLEDSISEEAFDVHSSSAADFRSSPRPVPESTGDLVRPTSPDFASNISGISRRSTGVKAPGLMLRMFKIGHSVVSPDEDPQTVGQTIPLVTSVPRDPLHSLMHLFRLEVPKVLGTVVRLAASEEGAIAGCTVHGEIFVFSKLPYSRHPDSVVTRGHDGGIVDILWLTGELKHYIVTNGTDGKTLLWQFVSETNSIEGPQVEIRHSAVPTCCSLHPVNRDIVIIGFLDHSFAMYKISQADGAAAMTALGISASFPKPITALKVSPDGRLLAVGSSVGTVGLFDLNTLSLDAEVDCRNRTGATSSGRKVTSLHWSEDSTCVVVSSCDSRVRIILISDLSRRTKFKSPVFVVEHMFLGSVFGPPHEDRILAVSENGTFCSWNLHANNETNQKCVKCNFLSNGGEVVAVSFVPATTAWSAAVQANLFDLGPGFPKDSGMFVLTCDATGSIRIFAELWATHS